MPLPRPRKKEKERDFLSLCMKAKVTKEYKNIKQRVVVCYSQWRRVKKK
ncbi:hypothetical protein IIA95_01130 [Patescibacteria group bacterium]|nr:hypothetical protein [Patescibacteria group bacterium]